ncbi:hypothetical protein V6N11_040450 [Hibiscus sabdariffa]|uniref:Uncharacterized protein n=1 Tax=Hibiscus sabdariffa TaxID=183260 RepID=A0ABR2RHR1_9ROSI
MVDLSVATEHSRANDPGVLDLREFPALADLRMVGSGGEVRQQVVDVAIGDKRTADKLWGREGSLTIRFLAPGVYLLNFPSKGGDSSCFLKGVESDVIVPKVGTAGAVGDVMSDSVEGLANGKVADGMVAGVVNESVNAEVVGGVVVGSDGDVAVAIGAGVYDASIEVVVAVDSVVSASSGDVDKIVHEGSSWPERVAAGGVAELMDKLKPNEKGGKRKGKGRGATAKGSKEGVFTPSE